MKPCPKYRSILRHLFPFVLRHPVIAGTLLKVWGSCAYISAPVLQLLKSTLKANQHVLQCCCLLFSASPPNFLSLPLFTLSISPASHKDEQMLPGDKSHINDCWLLTPNELPLYDQFRSPLGAELVCLRHGAKAGFGKLSIQLKWK